jgi:C1A family cysteine protease
VSSVKNQGSCGSCYAFSAGGAAETIYYNSKGTKLNLSIQQIVDCNCANQGCNGGLMNLVYEYALKNTWETEESYPYKGMEKDCHHKQGAGYQVLSGYSHLLGQADITLSLQKGPISGAVNANNM